MTYRAFARAVPLAVAIVVIGALAGCASSQFNRDYATYTAAPPTGYQSPHSF